MFTGIVEEVGTVARIQRGGASAKLSIRAKKVLEGTKTGDSIAVNGICLTVTKMEPGCFWADVMHETLNRSALVNLAPGTRVNLERAMAADSRFGGYMVAGHVDGISLTVAKVTEEDFSVSTIPHTVSQTTLGERTTGDQVNLETDVIGKYVEKLLLWRRDEGNGAGENADTQKSADTRKRAAVRKNAAAEKGAVTREFLARCGF